MAEKESLIIKMLRERREQRYKAFEQMFNHESKEDDSEDTQQSQSIKHESITVDSSAE